MKYKLNDKKSFKTVLALVETIAPRLALSLLGGEWLPNRARSDRGAATAEYIVATLAAVGFATLLLVILRSDEVKQLLLGLVRQALTVKP